MNRIVATMDDLPELPFEKVLSYLNLEERLKARAVSRRWYHKINSFKVKSLCCSDGPIGSILGKSHWVSGAFAENFISCTRFESFFKAYGQSVLSNLKHLRLCDLSLDLENQVAFTRTLNSFGQLEELDIVRAKCVRAETFVLSLPIATSIHLEKLVEIKLTLNAPKLTKVRVLDCCCLRLDIVHGESVESLISIRGRNFTMKNLRKLKNLRYLFIDFILRRDSTFLSSLKQLKEIHTDSPRDVTKLFEQKQRYGRADLKIYLCGLLLNGPDDPARKAFQGFNDHDPCLSTEMFVQLAENSSRLADEIPCYRSLHYSAIERVASGLEAEVLKRCSPQLNKIKVSSPVQDIQRFLDFLKNCWKNIAELAFKGGQPQDLFNRLPEHCAVQSLTIYRAHGDLSFLFRLKHLIRLEVHALVSAKFVRKAFEELQSLSSFTFKMAGRSDSSKTRVRIEIRHKRFSVLVGGNMTSTHFSDLNAAIEYIEFIFGDGQKKRKADELQ